MTEEKIKTLVAKLRKLVPARGEWTTLAEHACGDAADALESMLVKSAMTDEQKVAALQERALELTVEYAPKHEYTDPDDGTRCFSALGFARDLVQELAQETVEVSRLDRTVTIYADSVMRVWGPDVETEMSNVPRSYHAVLEALDWLYAEEPENREKPMPIEKLMDEYRADGCDFKDIEWVKLAALRYVDTMRDSQVRALLYALATAKTEQEPNAWRDPTNGDPAQSVTFSKSIAEKWPHIFRMPLYAKPTPECKACSNTGYIPEGNHCMACSEPADPNIEELFSRQQAGFERCFEALGITDDRERSWSSLVLAINGALEGRKQDFEFEGWFDKEYPQDDEGHRPKYNETSVMTLLRHAFEAGRDLTINTNRSAIVPLTEPVSIAKALLAGELVKLVTAPGGETAAFLVNIQLTSWNTPKLHAEGFISGFNYAAKWMQNAMINQAGEPVAWISDYALRCLKGNADATCSPQGMREFDQNIPLYEHMFALTENQRTALEAAIRILANGEHNSKYSEYLKPLLDAPAKEVPVKASAKKRLTDVQIKDAVDAIDFGTMVTADDFIYVIARAVLEAAKV